MVASQLEPEVLEMPPEPGYDSLEDLWANILDTKNGRAWYIAWRQGKIDDAQVDQRFGMVVLQNFQARWQTEARAASQLQSGTGPSSGTAAGPATGFGLQMEVDASSSRAAVAAEHAVDLSAPTQLVAFPEALAGDLVDGAAVAAAAQGAVDTQEGPTSHAAVLGAEMQQPGDGSHALPDTTVEDSVADEIREDDLTRDDDTTWTGRAMRRWQQEGRFY